MLGEKYETLQVVVEAVQFKGAENGLEIEQWVNDNGTDASWNGYPAGQNSAKEPFDAVPGKIRIRTLEGTMTAEPGDWIIRGIKGEFYPCKDEIFVQSHRKAI